MGSAFTAANLDGQLVVWGGYQCLGEEVYLPADVIYIFNHRSQTWKNQRTKGEIHPGFRSSEAAVCNHILYLFGGKIAESYTNVLSTLTLTGHFERLSAKGDDPLPRVEHRCFTYDGKVFIIAGFVKSVVKSRVNDFDEVNDLGFIANNDLLEFNPKSRRFSRLKVKGTRLSPRGAIAIETVDHRAFIHGGTGRGGRLRDFYVLDLTSLVLTEIANFGFPRGMDDHTITRVSDRHLLFVGGGDHENISNEVKLFDTEGFLWKDLAPIPEEVGAGLKLHRAVKFLKEDGCSVICLGGYVDLAMKKHPSSMIVFDVTRCW